MRILLAAVNAPKCDLDGNLARHLAVLDQARAQRCEVAVFPELSLTGSVDPRRHPERALALDAEPVRALLDGTRRAGVAAVFGIAERAGSAFHITQVYGHSGRLGGAYRKRHLGEGEEGYRTGEGPWGVPAGGGPGSGSPSAPRAGSTSPGPRRSPAGRAGCSSARPGPGRAPHRRAGLARGARLVGRVRARRRRPPRPPAGRSGGHGHPGRVDRGRGLPGTGRPRVPGRRGRPAGRMAPGPSAPGGARRAEDWPLARTT
jgi:Carbon-nitrogen hydrolase